MIKKIVKEKKESSNDEIKRGIPQEKISIKSSSNSSLRINSNDYLKEEKGIEELRKEEEKWETPAFLKNKQQN